jgi:hypothetical protein
MGYRHVELKVEVEVEANVEVQQRLRFVEQQAEAVLL